MSSRMEMVTAALDEICVTIERMDPLELYAAAHEVRRTADAIDRRREKFLERCQEVARATP